MVDDRVYAGLRVRFDYIYDGVLRKNQEILIAECFKKEFIFQIICLSGYHAGKIQGYVRDEYGVGGSVYLGYLKKELERNFGEIIWEKLEIIDSSNSFQ